MQITNIKSAIESREEMSNKKIVVITGVTGQDGSNMVDFLLSNHKDGDIHIFGGARRLSISNHENIKHLEGNPNFSLINLDVTGINNQFLG